MCLQGSVGRTAGSYKPSVPVAVQLFTKALLFLQGSVGTIARGHEASVRIAVQGHHAAAAAARLPVTTLSQMLKSALSVELDTRHVSQRLMRLIKTDRWHIKAEQILKAARPTGLLQLSLPLCCAVLCYDITAPRIAATVLYGLALGLAVTCLAWNSVSLMWQSVNTFENHGFVYVLMCNIVMSMQQH